MRKVLFLLIGLAIVLIPALLLGTEKDVRFTDVQPDLETAIARLSRHINIFESVDELKRKLYGTIWNTRDWNFSANLLTKPVSIT